MTRPAFEWICEIEPPTKPDMTHVRHQIGVLSKVASAYLIPDNHVGRATVSSIAVAHEVDRMARKLVADIPEITVPQSWIDAIEDDRGAGVGHACELAHRIAESGAFDGVHLIPGVRYREAAARLEN